ncbi:hypothetical protein T492DRAFT_836449 [Pavlovales sp. CCMP2436]|nr:hypothetical protein T492DRAFT_836449 [Pavlovales sp. CCMP2436]
MSPTLVWTRPPHFSFVFVVFLYCVLGGVSHQSKNPQMKSPNGPKFGQDSPRGQQSSHTTVGKERTAGAQAMGVSETVDPSAAEDAIANLDAWIVELASHSPSAPVVDMVEKLEVLAALTASRQIRDADFSAAFPALLVCLLTRAWSADFESQPLRLTYLLFTGMLHLPELDVDAVVGAIGHEFLTALFERITSERPAGRLPRGFGEQATVDGGGGSGGGMGAEGAAGAGVGVALTATDEFSWLRTILHWLYRSAPLLRPPLRARIGLSLVRAASVAVPPPGTPLLLEVLMPIMAGFSQPPREAHAALLLEVLLPLHRPAGKVEGHGPCLGAYHQQLVQCEPLRRAAARHAACLLPATGIFFLNRVPPSRRQ